MEKTAEGQKVAVEISESGDERTLSNIRLSLRAKMRRYATIAAATEHWRKEGRLISMTDWAKRGKGFLVLGAEKSADSGIEALNQAIIWILTREWLKAEDSPHDPIHYMVLDEVQSAGKQSALPRLLNEGREKGVCAIIGFQDVSSLYAIYGQHETDAMLAQFAHKAFLRLQGTASPRWAAEMIGEVEELHVNFSSSESRTDGTSPSTSYQTSRSEQIVRQLAVIPGEIKSLPPTNAQNGMTGYYDSPDIAVWLDHTEAAELWSSDESTKKKEKTDFAEIDAHLQWLDEDDFRRLGLSPVEPDLTDKVLEEELKKQKALPNVKKDWSLQEAES